MKLKKFTKNKKIKTIFIGSIVGILFIIGGISLYRSFAMYKVEKTFDVLQGTVPNFRKTYTEELLKGADPVLDKEGELVPVKISDKGEVTKADITQEWYSYANKKWANAVILTEEGKQQNIGVNEKIEEKYIESYFVWIPKYRYKLWDLGLYSNVSKIDTNKVHPIEIEFGLEDTIDDETKEEYKQCKTPMNDEGTQGLSGESKQCNEGDWMTHPAFISFGVNGLWVGKFETGYKGATSTSDAQNHNTTDKSKVVIKPNVYSWRNINQYNMFYNSYNYKRDLDSHLMKNTEWGAVAYLSHSKYGNCEGNTCSKVRLNNNSGYVTGYAAVREPTIGCCKVYSDYGTGSLGSDITNKSYNYTNSLSVIASTTNNYSGIYDMSGGAAETMSNFVVDSNQNIIFGDAGFTSTTFNINEKYYDKYIQTVRLNYTKRILGDAVGEMGPYQEVKYGTSTRYISSWYSEMQESHFSPYYFIGRGEPYMNGLDCGLFASGATSGIGPTVTFRIVLTPQ